MHPICFHIGSKAIYWYGVMTAMGFLAAVIHWSLLARSEGRYPGFGSDLGFWAMIGGILGARVAYVIANWETFAAEPLTIIRIDQGGLIYYGGFIGGALAIALFARMRKENPLAMGDFAVTGLSLGHAFGRVGCLLNGCCYGKPTDLPIGIHFPEASEPWLHYPGLALHPTQVYEVLWNLLIYAGLCLVYRRKHRPGHILAIYLIFYPVGRFFFEFVRGDERLAWLGMTVAQWISLGFIAAGMVTWVIATRSATARND